MEQPIAETEGRSFDGGCHCRAIRFRMQGPLRKIPMCHCSDCLKISGTRWGASAALADNLDWVTDARPRLVPQLGLGRGRILQRMRITDVL